MTENPAPARKWTNDFAEKHGVNLRFESPLPNGVPGYKYDDDDGAVVVLDSSLPSERQNFALAHEVAHILLDHREEVSPDEEMEANSLASELLLPEQFFLTESWRNLRELKDLFPHASFEVLARRKVAAIRGVLSIVDNQRLVRRICSEGFSAPSRPTDPEWKIIRLSYETSDDVVIQEDGFSFEATYVDEGRGVVRVLLIVVED